MKNIDCAAQYASQEIFQFVVYAKVFQFFRISGVFGQQKRISPEQISKSNFLQIVPTMRKMLVISCQSIYRILPRLSMSHNISFAFLCANSMASKRPIPLPAPVTRQISPSTDLYLAGRIHLQSAKHDGTRVTITHDYMSVSIV